MDGQTATPVDSMISMTLRNGHKRTMNLRESTPADGSARAVARNVGHVVNDVVELSELQMKLLSSDLKSVVRRAILPLVGVVTGICLALGTVPVLLTGLARVLETQSDLAFTSALLLTGAGALILAVIGVALAGWFLRQSLRELDRSRAEFVQNLAWVKQSLKPGT